jgi:hypothetical protein
MKLTCGDCKFGDPPGAGTGDDIEALKALL